MELEELEELFSMDVSAGTLRETSLALFAGIRSVGVPVSRTLELDVEQLRTTRDGSEVGRLHSDIWNMCHNAVDADGRFEIHRSEDNQYLWITETPSYDD